MALLISKINDIPIIQVGESKLSIENESEDGGKTGGRIIGFTTAKKGEEKTIDLGKGKRKHILKIYALNRVENDTLFKIFYEKPFCTIVDKFRGKIKVYVDSVDIIDSDKHVNRTVYDITCTIQSADFVPTVNVEIKLASAVESMESEIDDMVYEFADMVDSTETETDPLTGDLVFVDSSLNILRDGIDVEVGALNAYDAVQHRVDTEQRLFETIKSLKVFPDDLSNLLKSTTKSIDLSKKVNFGNTQKSEITEIIEPVVNGIVVDVHNEQELYSFLAENGISQTETEIILKELASANIANKVKVMRDMNSVTEGGFNSRRDFESTINAIVERLDHVGYSTDEISEKVFLTRSFANQQNYREIIEIEIKRPTPLVELVYERYGNLDNYQSIEAMNGVINNDNVDGILKVFA